MSIVFFINYFNSSIIPLESCPQPSHTRKRPSPIGSVLTVAVAYCPPVSAVLSKITVFKKTINRGFFFCSCLVLKHSTAKTPHRFFNSFSFSSSDRFLISA
ncbi:hypothetical protein [Kochikohdavirus PBEF19]|uniref:Uncharacterized protein n=1 Tax=Enterococcus phage PBEF129 TaxID=2696337 RepID=A0A7T3JEN2_9CAUD|nr:hypothetical protein [Enterococcus phage PBEF129]